MSVEELNFKKLSTEKYRVYRLLQSPSNMADTYRQRIKAVGGYRGAVIFPEQFISLYGQNICRVSISRDQDSLGASAVIYRNFTLWSSNGAKALRSFDDVLDAEKNDETFKLLLASPKEANFYSKNYEITYDSKTPTYWFSNKADALAYLRKNLTL